LFGDAHFLSAALIAFDEPDQLCFSRYTHTASAATSSAVVFPPAWRSGFQRTTVREEKNCRRLYRRLHFTAAGHQF
jgi:hypothetical protein